MSRIFDVDNGFFRFMTRVADALILNLIFLITCIPVVTIGASYTAMYNYCLKAVNNEEGYIWKSYWKSFKTNFVQGFLFEVIFAIIGIILYIDIKYMYVRAFAAGGAFGWKLLFFIAVGMVVLAISYLQIILILIINHAACVTIGGRVIILFRTCISLMLIRRVNIGRIFILCPYAIFHRRFRSCLYLESWYL